MQTRNLVTAASRYIAGRNAVQTVYWRSPAKSTHNAKFVKVSKTCNFGKFEDRPSLTSHVRQEQQYRF